MSRQQLLAVRYGRLTKRLQPTGRGAASSTPELGEPRPAAEAHVVSRQENVE